ncbi:hypothetical protein [Nocardia sp. NPDC056100]|uniref:hypothetical protein n=1 Tax=Nocardia sp. NPDC056100 TaxID=3345712 RepID=UPI0035DCAA4A
MDRLADVLTNSRAELRAEGVYVDVYATGQVRAIVIDEDIAPDIGHLGAVITDLINRAREQAQIQAAELVHEVQSDPRVAVVVERLGDAPERALAQPTASENVWDFDDDPYRRKSRIAD